MNEELTNEETKLHREFAMNYLLYLSQLVSNNINSIYKYYGNDYEFSLNDIIKTSQDCLKLNSKEMNILYRLIGLDLKYTYKYKIISKNNEKLKLKGL